jgi:hypothetical protein
VFTARYALSPYIKQIRFVFKGLKMLSTDVIIQHRWQMKRGISVIIMTEYNWSTRRKTWPSASLSTTNPTWNVFGWTQASAMSDRSLTASAMTRPRVCVGIFSHFTFFLSSKCLLITNFLSSCLRKYRSEAYCRQGEEIYQHSETNLMCSMSVHYIIQKH